MAKALDITGQRFGRLIAITPHSSDNRGSRIWLMKCDCGASALARAGNLRSGNTRSCGCGQGGPGKRPSEMGYVEAHRLIRRSRGVASSYPCVDCNHPARDWSLCHDAPVTYWGYKNKSSCRYSADPNDYAPRCKRCHVLYDRRVA